MTISIKINPIQDVINENEINNQTSIEGSRSRASLPRSASMQLVCRSTALPAHPLDQDFYMVLPGEKASRYQRQERLRQAANDDSTATLREGRSRAGGQYAQHAAVAAPCCLQVGGPHGAWTPRSFFSFFPFFFFCFSLFCFSSSVFFPFLLFFLLLFFYPSKV